MTFKINPETLEFDLPENLIAQTPLQKRDHARLLVLDRQSGKLSDVLFGDIVNFLNPGNVLVVNKARVNRAKLVGKKITGGKVEVIFLQPARERNVWTALVRPLLKEGTAFIIGERTRVSLVGRTPTGECLLKSDGVDPRELMEEHGKLPLPPYIKRDPEDKRDALDDEGYQTVYATVAGSVAAPTAGLHFSKDLLNRIQSMGVDVVEVLLNVGWGTFKPIAENVSKHTMLPETYEVPKEIYARLQKAHREGRRIVSVGTTSTRVLESLPIDGPVEDKKGAATLFITPGFQFKWLSGLVTNFHVPRSTPVALASAFCGLENLEKAYAHAIEKGYRFFSYGDAMLIL